VTPTNKCAASTLGVVTGNTVVGVDPDQAVIDDRVGRSHIHIIVHQLIGIGIKGQIIVVGYNRSNRPVIARQCTQTTHAASGNRQGLGHVDIAFDRSGVRESIYDRARALDRVGTPGDRTAVC